MHTVNNAALNAKRFMLETQFRLSPPFGGHLHRYLRQDLDFLAFSGQRDVCGILLSKPRFLNTYLHTDQLDAKYAESNGPALCLPENRLQRMQLEDVPTLLT